MYLSIVNFSGHEIKIVVVVSYDEADREAQNINISIGEHRHCCVTFEI